MRQLNFCLGNSRQSAVWHLKQMTIDELEERSRHQYGLPKPSKSIGR